MNILEKILKKDPLFISDDDHPERKDLTEKEADEAFKLLAAKFKNKKQLSPPGEFQKAVVDGLNSL